MNYLFPFDAIGARAINTGNTTTTLATVPGGSTYTVLYSAFNSNTDTALSFARIMCGSRETLTVHDGKKVPDSERFRITKCEDSIVFQTTGFASIEKSTANIVYVPYDISILGTASTSASGTLPSVAGGFTYGELVSTTLSLLIFSVLVYWFFIGTVRGHKIKL